jgi:hypothetical protein
MLLLLLLLWVQWWQRWHQCFCVVAMRLWALLLRLLCCAYRLCTCCSSCHCRHHVSSSLGSACAVATCSRKHCRLLLLLLLLLHGLTEPSRRTSYHCLLHLLVVSRHLLHLLGLLEVLHLLLQKLLPRLCLLTLCALLLLLAKECPKSIEPRHEPLQTACCRSCSSHELLLLHLRLLRVCARQSQRCCHRCCCHVYPARHHARCCCSRRCCCHEIVAHRARLACCCCGHRC